MGGSHFFLFLISGLHEFLPQASLMFLLNPDSSGIAFLILLVFIHELLHESWYFQHLCEDFITRRLQLTAFPVVKHPHQLSFYKHVRELVKELLGLRIDDPLTDLGLNISGHLLKHQRQSSHLLLCVALCCFVLLFGFVQYKNYNRLVNFYKNQYILSSCFFATLE